eukprot:199854-Prymnesium_polylepis.1
MLAWAALGLVQHEHCPGEWVDVDSPPSACSTRSEHDGREMTLIFSDEFDRPGRTFNDGDDVRWTGLNSAPYSNEQVNYYNSSHAFTRGGVLDILCTNDYVTFEVNGTRENPEAKTETRGLQTAMIQSWNKFCFQEGVVELSARMPGPHGSQEGLWPGFWMMGNLGRATFERSTDGFWPWIFDECVPWDHEDCDANQCTSQKVSACMADPGYGFNPYQGRGAPEIDIIEVQPGSFVMEYGENRAECQHEATAADKHQLRMPQPFVSTSLQAAPGLPRGSQQRPGKGCRPYNYTHNGT